MKHLMLTPGPVTVPEVVLDACSRQPMYHHSNEFIGLAGRVRSMLGSVLGTEQNIVLIPGSATNAIAHTILSIVTSSTQVAILVNGRFSKRIADMVKPLASNSMELTVEWGKSFSIDEVRDFFNVNLVPDVLWLVHGETSTGVTIDLKAIIGVVRELHPACLVCVDAVSTLGVHPLFVDDWSIDVCISGIQKGLLSPPGLALVTLSSRAVDVANESPLPEFCGLRKYINPKTSNGFAGTPPVNLISGLAVSLHRILEEGMENVWQRHAELAALLRNGLRANGFQIFGEGTSNAVTVIQHPSPATIIQALHSRGIIVAESQDILENLAFRIGTCGNVSSYDIVYVLNVLKQLK